MKHVDYHMRKLIFLYISLYFFESKTPFVALQTVDTMSVMCYILLLFFLFMHNQTKSVIEISIIEKHLQF